MNKVNKEIVTNHKKLIIAGIIGNIIEWYDFAVYGYLVLIIAQVFFPTSNPATSLIATFSAFAIGFLIRPLGSLLFGYIGDKFGRKRALIISVMLMAVPTFLIGALPNYNQIGIAAPILLVILRILQGLSVGGEYTTSIAFLTENSPKGKRGFMASWSIWGATAGVLLGSAVAALISTIFSTEEIIAWAWRLPFLCGIVIAFFAFYIRIHINDSVSADHQYSPAPIRETFSYGKILLLKVMGINLLEAVTFYTIFVYTPIWLQQISKIPASIALNINNINMITTLLIIPLSGILTDKIGRKPVLLSSSIAILILSFPSFLLMNNQYSLFLTWFGQFILSGLIAIFVGASTITTAEIVPARIRVTTISVGYNLVQAIFGGTTPIICTYLIKYLQFDLSPALYLSTAALISILFIVNIKETANLSEKKIRN